MFANSVKKALNAVVPRKLWPKIKKRLRFALNQRGILFEELFKLYAGLVLKWLSEFLQAINVCGSIPPPYSPL